MITVGVREAKHHLAKYMRVCQAQSVVITKHGHPVAILIGVMSATLDDVTEVIHRFQNHRAPPKARASPSPLGSVARKRVFHVAPRPSEGDAAPKPTTKGGKRRRS